MPELTLDQFKNKLETIKRDKAIKEGELAAVMGDLLKQFGVKNLDAAYKKLDVLQNQREIKQEQFEDVQKQILEKLKQYGY